MNIVEKNIADLKPYKNNPRLNNDAVGPVANSIKEFGFKVPIIIDKDGVIVAGHTRYKAAKKLGMTSVPCIVADDLTPEQIKAFRIADNKVGELASWDLGSLVDELTDIDLDMTDFGFGIFELDMIMEDFTPVPYDDSLIEKYVENEENYRKNDSIIIKYTDETEPLVKDLLGVEGDLKVLYRLEELV